MSKIRPFITKTKEAVSKCSHGTSRDSLSFSTICAKTVDKNQKNAKNGALNLSGKILPL
jgi:hypothetical protein